MNAEYSDVANALIRNAPEPSLARGVVNPVEYQKLDDLDAADLFPGMQIQDPEMADCCLAGLWLLHNELDRSHQISQQVKSQSGSFWHGIMHRREEDFWNAKHWFRNAGHHPVFPELKKEFETDYVNAEVFVDACEEAMGQGDQVERRCLEIQSREWELLFDFCWKRALGQ